MKTYCVNDFLLIRVWGDLAARRYDDQYPTRVICRKCFDKLNTGDETNPIIEVLDYDDYYGDQCKYCDPSNEDRED